MVPLTRRNLLAEKGRFGMSVAGVAFAVLLVLIGLEPRLRFKAGDLSAGERQRVAIARALANCVFRLEDGRLREMRTLDAPRPAFAR